MESNELDQAYENLIKVEKTQSKSDHEETKKNQRDYKKHDSKDSKKRSTKNEKSMDQEAQPLIKRELLEKNLENHFDNPDIGLNGYQVEVINNTSFIVISDESYHQGNNGGNDMRG